MTFTEVFGGTTIYPSGVSYRAVALSADQTLSWPVETATSGNVVAQIMDVTPSAGSLSIIMPPANEVSVGETTLFFNPGSFTFTVKDTGGNTIVAVPPGLSYQVYLIGNATPNGTWRSTQYAAGTSSATAGSLVGAGIKAISTTLNQSMSVTTLNSNYTIGDADRSEAFVWTGGAGALILPASGTVGNDWFCHVRNGGTGAITVTPTGSELINGAPNLTFNPGDSAIIICDGSSFFTIGFGQSAAFAFDYVSIDLSSPVTSPYTLSGANLNRIAYSFGGTLTTNMEVYIPATIQQYWISNNTSGAFSLTVKVAGQIGVVIPQGSRGIYYCNGTDIIDADTASFAFPLTVAQGGTGATTESGARINLGGTSVGIGVFTAVTAADGRNALLAAKSGANSDITSLSGLTTPLSVGQGGTGAATLTANGVVVGNGTSAVQVTAAGTTGQVLVGNTGGAPSWATLTGIGVTSFSGGTTGLTPASPTTGAITLAGTLGVANGGTGTATAFTAGSVVFAGASGVYSQDNANLFWDNTNNYLGVGTATPSAPFHVKLTTDRNARFLNAYSSVAIGSTTDVGAEAPLAFFANPITFVTNNVERMRVDASGNVGIATSSPTALLTVNGTAKVGEGVATNTSKFMVNTLSGVAAGIQLIQDANESWIIQNPASTNVLTFSNSGTERMRITAGGNVGIGTTTPGASLEISSTFDELFRLTSTGSPYASWYTGATRRGYIQAQAGAFNVASDSAIPLILATNATERMRITDTGLVGIGTSSPEAKLTVAGTAGTISGAGLSVFETSTGNNARLRITQSAGFVTYDATYSAGGNQQVWSNAGTERMRLTEAGNLLVGTTTALSRLTVGSDGTALNADAITIFGSLSAVSTGQAISWYQNTASVRSGYVALNTNSGGGESELHFGTTNVFGVNNATTKMVILGGGNVGIGTTSPTVYTGFTTLEIDNASNGGILSIKKAGSVVGYLNGASGMLLLAQSNDLKLTTTGATSMQFSTNSTERMRIDASGNVGIGTSSPTYRLHVSSASTNGLGVYRDLDVTAVGAAGQLIEIGARDGATFTPGAAIVGILNNPATTGSLSFQTRSGGALATNMTINSSGNVGIGTSSPSTRLHVEGSGAELRVQSTTAQEGFVRFINTSGSMSVGMSGSPANELLIYDRTNSQTAYIYAGGASGYHVWYTTGSERMRIDSSGNLLVGTTTSDGYRFKTEGSYPFLSKGTGGAALTAMSIWNNDTTGDNIFIVFSTEAGGTTRGSIDYNRAGGLTRYNTTSDYRAKDIVGPVQNSGAVVDALKVYDGKMKGATIERPMLIAHEAQEVVPYAVTGEKDAVNEDGTPKFQQIDVSSLVPLLIAESQSLRARVAQLEGK